MFQSSLVPTARHPTRARSAAPWFAAPVIGTACLTAMAQSMLPPVTVTATRFSDAAADLPFGVSVLTANDIQASGATTVNDAIMRLLGVPGRIDFYGGGDYALDLRGFGTTSDSKPYGRPLPGPIDSHTAVIAVSK